MSNSDTKQSLLHTRFFYYIASSVCLFLAFMLLFSGVYLFKTLKNGNQPIPPLALTPSKLSYPTDCQDLESRIKYLQQERDEIYYFNQDIWYSPVNGVDTKLPVVPYHSETNVQVAGIDEGDIVKTDGTTVYVMDRESTTIKIAQVYPFGVTKKLGEIHIESTVRSENLEEMFLQKNSLIIISSNDTIRNSLIRTTTIWIYNVADPSNPNLTRTLDVGGDFQTARIKDGAIYLITVQQDFYDDTIRVPQYRDSGGTTQYQDTAECNEIAFIDPGYAYPTYTTVTLLDSIENTAKPVFTNFIGNTQTVYMGEESIYLLSERMEHTSKEGLFQRIDRFINPIPTYDTHTRITKLAYDKSSVRFAATTTTEGSLLNQFSLDEYEGNLRIAATIGDGFRTSFSSNYLKILDKNLNQLSIIDNLAHGEKIYSVRFQGTRGVVVTFKKVDPVFVFDLSDPKKPVLKGELKIPGYSVYLHFIDDSTVIGFGKDTVEADQVLKNERNLDFAWFQGLKLALFDISNMEKPVERSKIIMGDRGSDSPALLDHRAFLFDKRNNLIVIPAKITKVDPKTCVPNQLLETCYGVPASQGAQVVSIQEGKLVFVQEISHGPVEPIYSSYYHPESEVLRSIIIDKGIVTISTGKITIHEIGTMKLLQTVEL